MRVRMELEPDIADFPFQEWTGFNIGGDFLAGGGYRGGIAVAEFLPDLSE